MVEKELTQEAQQEPEAPESKVEKRYVVISEEDLDNLIRNAGREGAKKGVEAYEKRKEKEREELADKLRNSAKDVIINYRRLKGLKNTSVCDVDSVTDPTLKEILDGLAGRIREDEFTLNSTTRNKIKTGMLMNHVDVKLEEYKKECRRSRIIDVQRRYRVIEMLYLREDRMSVEEVAEAEECDKSTIYRTLEKAYDDLTVLMFGIDGVITMGMKRQARKNKGKTVRSAAKEKYSNAKKMH